MILENDITTTCSNNPEVLFGGLEPDLILYQINNFIGGVFPPSLYIKSERRGCIMAQAIMSSSRLTIYYEIGMDGEGKPIYKMKSYPNVKEAATADQLYQVAQALASLSSYSLSSVKRNDVSDLI